jgi:hypothetical protein
MAFEIQRKNSSKTQVKPTGYYFLQAEIFPILASIFLPQFETNSSSAGVHGGEH